MLALVVGIVHCVDRFHLAVQLDNSSQIFDSVLSSVNVLAQ